MMDVVINGKPTHLTEAVTITDLLRRHDLHPTRVAIEINREILPRKFYDSRYLKSGDQIEIVTFVGGG